MVTARAWLRSVARAVRSSRMMRASVRYTVALSAATPKGRARKREKMDTNTLLIIVVVILLLGGGGFFLRGRR